MATVPQQEGLQWNKNRQILLHQSSPPHSRRLYSPWDHRNRLTNVTDRATHGGAATQTVDYVYDAFNRRIAKLLDTDGDSVVDEETYYINDGTRQSRGNAGDHVVLTLDDTAAVTHRYLHGPGVDQILADEDDSGDILWPLTDNLGTVRDLAEYDDVLDITSIANHIAYDAFGNVISETNSAVDHIFGYTGREQDPETGLNYNRARYYDPAVGRFVSEDPIGFAAGDPNPSRYVGNNVTGAVDPSGLEEEAIEIVRAAARRRYVNLGTGVVNSLVEQFTASERTTPTANHYLDAMRDVSNQFDDEYAEYKRSGRINDEGSSVTAAAKAITFGAATGGMLSRTGD